MNYRPVEFHQVKHRTTFFDRRWCHRLGQWIYFRVFKNNAKECEGVDDKLIRYYSSGATVFVRT